MKNKLITLTMAMVLATGVFAGCSKKEEVTAPSVEETVSVESGMVEDFHTAIKEVYGETYLPNMEFDEMMFSEIIGVTMENVKDFVAEVPMIGTYVDTLIIIEAEEGKAEEVEIELNEYREGLLADTMQYPMNLAKINASEVYAVDEYVFFVMLGAIDETNEDEEAQLEFAKEEVAKAIEAINTVVNN